MPTTPPQMMPKTHPLDREWLVEDPMELMLTTVRGDGALMLRCLIEEFAWMGYGPHELLDLFSDPEYPVLGRLLAQFGRGRVIAEIETCLEGLAGVRVSATVDETPDPDLMAHDDEDGLLQLTLRRR